MPDYYLSNIEHLMDELKRLDLMLRELVSRKGHGGGDDPFRGLYLTEGEADALLGGDDAERGSSQNVQNGHDQSSRRNQGKGDEGSDQISAAESSIRQKVEGSLEAGIDLQLCRLSRLFGLDRLELDAVVICAAAELDTKYEKIYGYLQDDMTRRSPSLGLVMDILCVTPEERLEVRRRFLPGSRLIREKIIEPADSREDGIQLSTALRLNPDILACLIGSGMPETAGKPQCSPEAFEPWVGVGVSDALQEKLKNLTRYLAGKGGRTVCHLQGPYGSGKREIAGQICAALGKRMAEIDLASLAADEKGFEAAAAISRVLRRALLEGSAIYVENLDLLASEDPRYLSIRSMLARSLESHPGLVILSSQGAVDLGKKLQRRTLALKIPLIDYPERRQIWADALGGAPGEGLSEEDLDDLASKFRFTGGQIGDAVSAAQSIASLEGRKELRKEDVYQGCRFQSSRKLSALSRRIEAKSRWEDIILPEDKLEQLRDIVSWMEHKGKVYNDWGFGKKLLLGKGLNVLFSGSSGTGKTLAAGILASELGLEMYKVDLSSLVSKYIGETEKNLSRVFQEAEQGNAILFFDEADAIFGKRTEVKDAHDRYANLEVGYLLQKMEEHQGMVILATNLSKNMDEAFTRRMHFIVEFPFPEEEYRRNIWKTLLPAEAPVAEDVDFDFLARKLQVAGGNIKNILVGAAFLAAENSGVINMEHIIRAAGKEYRKVGLICSQSDFGKYYHLVSR
jgi:ATP-dependent 26S proteasome regulatory subunit